MPEDTRVQQQVHVHIWMEADIIRVIVSDARRAVKVTLDVLGRKFWMLKIQKIHGSRRAASARGMSNQGLFGRPVPSGTRTPYPLDP